MKLSVEQLLEIAQFSFVRMDGAWFMALAGKRVLKNIIDAGLPTFSPGFEKFKNAGIQPDGLHFSRSIQNLRLWVG